MDPYLSLKRRGLMLVLSSPSGAGKTTIAKLLMKHEPDVCSSVSVTTRPKRPGEVEGKDYHFVDTHTFNVMRKRGDFIEDAHVFGYDYATPRHAVETSLSEGFDVLFDIDWQGTQQLRQDARSDLVTIFILPPTYIDLEKRLRKRAQDHDAIIDVRMKEAVQEISHWAEYDYVIINYHLDESIQKVRAVLHAERLRRERQLGIADFVKHLRP